MKIILDTNIIVSALLSPEGLPAKILNLVVKEFIAIVYDNDILIEYVNVLNRKKLKINNQLKEFVIDFIKRHGEYQIAKPQDIKFSDEDDKVFYELYKSGDVDYLITGNIKHFPKEKGIVTAREFIENNNFA